MNAAEATLTTPKYLANLIGDLEKGKDSKTYESNSVYIVATPSTDYPELDNLFVIPKSLPDKRILNPTDSGNNRFAQRDEWMNKIYDELQNYAKVSMDNVAFITVVIPGDLPDKVGRFSPKQDKRIRIRFLSAVDHLWIDRLWVRNSEERLPILDKLTAQWKREEYEQFIEPAISPILVDGRDEIDDLTEIAFDLLTQRNPDVPPNGLTVIYGPGGIGKTFFLKRVAKRYTDACKKDLLKGIPVFTALPLLLHRDALEIHISKLEAFRNLSLDQITTLIRHGVIVPFLDAFDELVRGALREGCKQFLTGLGNNLSSGGAGILTSRDYFLNIDPLIPINLSDYNIAQLAIGYFDKKGRKRFIQKKTNLEPEVVDKWSKALENEVDYLFKNWHEKEINGLVGHPLFMDAFCNYINKLPKHEVSKTADDFRFQTPDVFGEIIERLLEREQDKARAGWEHKFKDKFVGQWEQGPFSVENQINVFIHLTLLTAENVSKFSFEDVPKEWNHGLFDDDINTVKTLAEKKKFLRSIIKELFDNPAIAPQVDEDEISDLVKSAHDEIVDFYMQHALSYTEPDAPRGLLFATRHRAYFDYFLARAFVNCIYAALDSREVAEDYEVLNWATRYNVFERYSGCFDYLLWDPRIFQDGPDYLIDMFNPDNPADDTIASYYLTLGLALFIRRYSNQREIPEISQISLAPDFNWSLTIVPDLLPVISSLNVSELSFPKFTLQGDDGVLELRKLEVSNCEFEELEIVDCSFNQVNVYSISCSSLKLGGIVTFADCVLQFANIYPSDLKVEDNSKIHFANCRVSESLYEALEHLPPHARKYINLSNSMVIPDNDEDHEIDELSRGERFIHKLMTLVRKHGKSTWGVYLNKLRGLTGLGDRFDAVLDYMVAEQILVLGGRDRKIVVISPEVTYNYMFDGKRRPGRPGYDKVKSYWASYVQHIDEILS